MAQPPKAISLFSGAGGDTLGLHRAGYEVVAFSEFKKQAIATHLHEFPSSVLLAHPDTGATDITSLPDSVFEPYRNQIEVIFAGFPCQGFSHAGKKRSDDPRNELVNEFVRVVRIVQPRYLIGENVAGLLSRQGRDPVTQEMRPVIHIIRDLFATIGYHITYKVLKATQFGVPQERKRLIIVGSPASQGYPHLAWDTLAAPTSPFMTTIRPFLEDHLEGAVEFPRAHLPLDLSGHYWITTTATDPTGTPHPNLLRLVGGIRNRSSKEKAIATAEDGPLVVEGGLISFGVRKSSYHGQVLDPDMTSKTIICTYGTCPRLFVGLYHPPTDRYWVRCLSVRELGQIQGFSSDYAWQGNEKDKITQIGNAVPPPLCESIVRSLSTLTFHPQPQDDSATSAPSDSEED